MQARTIVAKVMHETDLFQSRIEIRVALFDFLVNLDHAPRLHLVGCGGIEIIRLGHINAPCHCRFGVKWPRFQLHQRV